MKSKTSLCNAVIFRKDITRFWPLWALELLMYLFLGVVLLLSQIANYRQLNQINSREAISYFQEIGEEIFALIVDQSEVICFSPLVAGWSIVVAFCLFLYLTREREAYMLHSFPMKRITIFVSHYLAGLVMLVVPVLVTGIGIILVGVANAQSVGAILWIYMAQTFIEILFFYSLACLVIMLTGNAFMSGLIYCVLNVLVAGVTFLYSMLADYFVYGRRELQGDLFNHMTELFTPIYSFWEHTGSAHTFEMESSGILREALGDLRFMAFYLIPTVIFIVLAILLYQKRSVESAGDMVAFSWGRPVFRIVFTFCSSMLFAVGIYESVFEDNIGIYAYGRIFEVLLVLVVIGAILFYLIGNMILDKTFFIWKKTSYGRMALLVVVMVGGMFFVKNGNLGSDLPDKQEIKSAMICFTPNETYDYYDYSYETPCFRLTDGDQVQEVYELNQEILEYGKNMNVPGIYPDMDSVYITYELKDGKSWGTTYVMEPECELSGKVDTLLQAQDVCTALFGKYYAKVLPEMLRVSKEERTRIDLSHNSLKLSRIRDEIYKAVLKDLQAERFKLIHPSEKTIIARIDIQMEAGSKEWDDAKAVSLYVTEECTETFKVLKKWNDHGDIELEL